MHRATDESLRIIYPALGAPALLEPDARSLTILVESSRSSELDMEFWLEEVPRRTRHLLRERSRLAVENPLIRGNRIAEYHRHRKFLQLELELPELPVGVSTPRLSLFDLHGTAHAPSRHAVALRSFGGIDLRFDYVADPHVATMWDKVDVQVSGLPEAEDGTRSVDRLFTREVLRENFLNPNTAFADFIRRCNEAARRGEVDLLVIGGDLVDYVYQRPRKGAANSYEDTNFWVFEQIVIGSREGCEELLVPMLTTTGNHDYRLYPYRLFSYGLRHCGLHHWQTAVFLERIPRKPYWIPNREDIDSISASKGKRHSLAHYYRYINPFDDFVVSVGQSTFVLLDTGRDVMFAAGDLGMARIPQLVNSVLFGGDDPDSEGLSAQQIEILRTAVRKKPGGHIFCIFHAGLLNSYPDHDVSEWDLVRPSTDSRVGTACEYRLPLRVALDGKTSNEDNVRFEAEVKRRRLGNGCIFRNQLEVLRAASEFKGNFVGLSGHAHRNLELHMDTAQGTITVSDYTSTGLTKRSGDSSALFLTPNALGHAQPKFDVINSPQHYRLRALSAEDLWVQRFVALPEGLDAFLFFARIVSRSQREVVLGCEISTLIADAGALRLTLIREGRSPVRWSGTVQNPVCTRLQEIPFRPSHFSRISIRSVFDAWEVELPLCQSVVVRLVGDAPMVGELSVVCELLERKGGSRVLGTRWHPRALVVS